MELGTLLKTHGIEVERQKEERKATISLHRACHARYNGRKELTKSQQFRNCVTIITTARRRSRSCLTARDTSYKLGEVTVCMSTEETNESDSVVHGSA